MEVTYLGHQGWAFNNAKGYVLMDAINEAIGNGENRLPVWPCRKLNFSEITPVKALIISHEHSDHFDLETLSKYPFRCNVWIPYLSSESMEATLKYLGYKVNRMQAFETFQIAGIKFTPLSMDFNKLEFDVYGMLVRTNKDTSFLTIIDAIPTSYLKDWLAINCPSRSLDNFTNNLLEPLPFLSDEHRDHRFSISSLTKELIHFTEQFEPDNCSITGQGWCYSGKSFKFLNHCFFKVSNEKMKMAGTEIFPHIKWSAPVPGDCYKLNKSKVTHKKKNLVITAKSPDRTYDFKSTYHHEIMPWSGLKKTGDSELKKVLDFIRKDYGPVLEGHAPILMKGLHSLIMKNDKIHIPKLFIRVKNLNMNYDFALHYGSFILIPSVLVLRSPVV